MSPGCSILTAGGSKPAQWVTGTHLFSQRRSLAPRGVGGGRDSSKSATYPVDDVHQARITEGVEGLEIEWRENKKRDW